MPKDAAEEIYIENANAKKAFVEFWRSMEAQGYQYGCHALSNVWVGFDGARSTLAQKVLAQVEAERLHENLDNEGDKGYTQAINDVSAALRELFQKEGVEVDSTST